MVNARASAIDGAEPRVLLFNAPWVVPSHAPLGLGIVTAQLRGAGIPVETRHPNVEFYRLLHDGLGPAPARAVYNAGEVGEVAAGLLYRHPDRPFDEEREQLAPLLQSHGISDELFWSVVRSLKLFTARYLGSLSFAGVRAVGFTLCIHQTMSSLYWAREIKALAPDVKVVFGGSTCEDPMGIALMESHPVIDAMARGEADTSIVPLFEALLDRSTEPLDTTPNVAFRRGDRVVATERELIGMADAVAPDHTDFVRAYSPVEAATGEPANLYLEASRGCWWGERRHCTFCGIHTTAITFREKSADRVLDEITDLLERHRVFRFVLADTILSRQHFETLLPRLEALRAEHDLEYLLDVKSPLSRDDAALLARSGCTALQIGIEALSDRLLRLMQKGNTALQQIQSIRFCTEVGILPFYAILTNVIGESVEDYEETLAHARAMRHLAPPSGVFPIEINRYAPYHDQWRELGFDRPEPAPYYRLMFGPDRTDLDRFAYHFVGTHPDTRSSELDTARAELRAFVNHEWAPSWRERRSSFRVGRGFVRVVRADTGGSRREERRLVGAEAQLFLACDQIATLRQLEERFDGILSGDRLRETLIGWCDAGLVVRSQRADVFLALPVAEHPLPSRPAPPGDRARRPGRRAIPVAAR